MAEEIKTEEVLTEEQAPEAVPAEEAAAEPKKKKKDRKADKQAEEIEALQAKLDAEKESYLRLAAEYDNYRKRTAKEKDHIYQDAVSDTLNKIFPIYDNLERALAQHTEDEAYKKGVEMIMAAMKETLSKCGVEPFGEPGDQFDPMLHNAVMHIEDESQGENVVVDVFQKGFKKGDSIFRCAMVRVAN